MKKDTVVPLRQPEGQDPLRTMLREGAQRLIAEALQAEFDEFLSQFAARRDDCVFRRNVTAVSDG